MSGLSDERIRKILGLNLWDLDADIQISGVEMIAEARAIEAEATAPLLERIERLEALLTRYRNETPIGHQPHMIAHEVDAALRQQPWPEDAGLHPQRGLAR